MEGQICTVNSLSPELKPLSLQEMQALQDQNLRLVSDFKALQLELNARKHWDLFYKRNENKFFKDRHWTTREFKELLGERAIVNILEVGCGVGNLIYPLIEEGLDCFIYACDFSPRAVEFVKCHHLYNETYIKAFCCDVTTNEIFDTIDVDSIDVVTLVFVLSAIHPTKFSTVLQNLIRVLKPGGVVLFRDYGLNDMAQLRFKAGNKISDNFYMRQDGTRSYYFSLEYLEKLFVDCGFHIGENGYVHRRTINKKENIDVPRIFVQGKFIKPVDKSLMLVS